MTEKGEMSDKAFQPNSGYGYDYPFGENGISGHSGGVGCYTIDFNFSMTTSLQVLGEISIYNLDSEICNRVAITPQNIMPSYKGDYGTLEFCNFTEFLTLTLSCRGTSKKFVFQVKNCYTTGFPTRKTTFMVANLLNPDNVFQVNSKTYNQLMDGKGRTINEWLKILAKQQGKNFIKEHNFIIEGEKVINNTCSDLGEFISTYLSRYTYTIADNNELKFYDHNACAENFERLNLNEKEKSNAKIVLENVKKYEDNQHLRIIDESEVGLKMIPYNTGNDVMFALAIPLDFNLQMNQRIELRCYTPIAKNFGFGHIYYVYGLSFQGRFSQTTECSGVSSLELLPTYTHDITKTL